MDCVQKRTVVLLLLIALVASMLPIASAAGYGSGYSGGMSGDDNGIYAQGVDLSEWQGDAVDFEKIKAQGYSFVILRAGFASTRDATFETNYTKAKAAGLDVGVYLYSYADNAQEARAEAEAVKSWLKGKVLEYPIYFDLEDPNSHEGRSSAELTEISLAFLDAVAADGWLVGLYTSKSWLSHKVDAQKVCAQYECWMAQYLNSGTYDIYDEYDGRYGMWQYSASGSVDGVEGYVDMNVCFKDYPSICRQYGFNGYAATGETLRLNGGAVPSVLACGDRFSVSGTVVSASGKLTNVTAGIYSASGEMVTGRSAGPKSESYDVSLLADGVKMWELPAGSYEYRVTATNTSQTRILMKQSLYISEAGIRLDEERIPQNLKEGDAFTPGGILTASSKLLNVTLSICDGDGAVKSKVTAEPNQPQLDLSKLPEASLTQPLPAGKYTYRIEAATEKGTQVLLDMPFSVWVRSDPITLEGFRLETEYQAGELTDLSGTIISQDSKLQAVTVTVTDSRGAVAAYAESAGAQKQLRLSELREQLQLASLAVGTYTCRIEAINAGGPKTVAEQTFLLRADAMELCALQAPTCICAGDTFRMDGMVTSDFSALRFVGVSVKDDRGVVCMDAAMSPQKNFCDLRELGRRLIFSALPEGEYRLCITAENESGFRTLYDEPFAVVNTEDLPVWEDGHFMLGGLSYYAGGSIRLWGTLLSANAQTFAVKAEVCRPDDSVIAEAHGSGENGFFDVSGFNEMLHFAALPSGDYYLKITAGDGTERFTMCKERFAVTDCPHVNVCTGEVYAAGCNFRGVICNSRCLDCGASVGGGTILPCEAHDYSGDRCSQCGRAAYKTVRVRLTDKVPLPTGRYMLAVNEGEHWYALGADGETVPIAAPDETGATEISAALLWAPTDKTGNVMCLENPQGEKMHLDSRSITSAAGGVNTALLFESVEGGGWQLRLRSRMTRCLSFTENGFSVANSPDELWIFTLELP